MSKPKATLEVVRATVVKLLLEGREPSKRNVCEITGGSYSTIGSLIEQVLDEMLAQNLAEISMSPEFGKAWAKEIGRHLLIAKEKFEGVLKPSRLLVEEARQKLAETEKVLEEVSDELKRKETLVSEMISQIVTITAQNSLLEKQVKKYEDEREATALRNEQLIKDGTIAIQALEIAQKKVIEDAEQISEIQRSNAELTNDLRDSHSKAAVFEERSGALKQRVEKLEEQMAQAGSETQKWLEAFHELQDEHRSLVERAAIAETKLSEMAKNTENSDGLPES